MKKIEKILFVLFISLTIIGLILMSYIVIKLMIYNKCYIQSYDEDFNYNVCEWVKDF